MKKSESLSSLSLHWFTILLKKSFFDIQNENANAEDHEHSSYQVIECSQWN